MSIARTKIKELVFLNTRVTVPGFTLFTPVNEAAAYIIDNRGNVINKLSLDYMPAAGAILLPNGNVLYMGKDPDSPCAKIEGAGGILQEIDQAGKVVWEYKDPMMHHEPIRLLNGNFLVMKWSPLDENLVQRVQGGLDSETPMMEDIIEEIDREGRVRWSWKTSSYLSPEEVTRCPICPRDSWIHMNSIYEMKNGNILVSFCRANQIAIIDRKSKNIIWNWDSKGEISHQHSPVELDNGNILIFDNGLHPMMFSTDFSRVVELDPASKKLTWLYMGASGNRLAVYFDSPMYSNCQKLESGNILISEGLSGSILEIAPNGETCWEYVNPYPLQDGITEPHSKPIFSAYKYTKDYPGVKHLKV